MTVEFSDGRVITIPDNPERDRQEDEKRERKLKEQRTGDHIVIGGKE